MPLQNLPSRSCAVPEYAVEEVPFPARGRCVPNTTALIRIRSRSRWKREIDELMAICDEAARRASLAHNPSAEHYESPVSREFVECRLELDDPLLGWMARERASGRMQGFILCSQFTTWVAPAHFRWLSPPAGAAGEISAGEKRNGSLWCALNDCTRDGDPLTTGCTWPRVAELSLVGGLGCGAALVSTLVAWLRSGQVRNPLDGRPYDFLVLQATKNAIPFYRRMGFDHVRAEARHFERLAPLPQAQAQTHTQAEATGVDEESQVTSSGENDGGKESKQLVPQGLGDWLPLRHFEYVVGDVEPSYMMAMQLRTADAGQTTATTTTTAGSANKPVWCRALCDGDNEHSIKAALATAEMPTAPKWLISYIRQVADENTTETSLAARNGGNTAQITRKVATGGYPGTHGASSSSPLMLLWARARATASGAACSSEELARPAKKRRVRRHRKKEPPQRTTLLSFFNPQQPKKGQKGTHSAHAAAVKTL
eukprot:g1909.t1